MPSLRVVPREVAWLPWSADAFARARAEHKPVLLSIATTWSQSCRDMDRTSYADPTVAFVINDAFVPVRVDADRRPDISERYALGGWPTTAFLTPDGEVLGGGTYVDAARMPRVLEDVRAAFQRSDGRLGRERAPLVAPPPARVPPDPAGVRAHVFDLYDEAHGGFGSGEKFPHTAPLHLALEAHRRQPDPRLERMVTTTLDAMGWGGLYDEAHGGFFRYAGRDWQHPQREKTLDVNAHLLLLYVEAAESLGIGRFAQRAADVLRYVASALADPDGGWYGAERAGDDEADRALFADANGRMASAAIRAAGVFADPALLQSALRSLERVLLACYRPGQGVAHYFDGRPRVRGLLGDQIAMATALLDAFDAAGDIVHEMMAEELAHYAIRELWDADGGGFFDRTDDADDVGLMRVRLKPFVANCEAARMLKRLAARSGDQEFARTGGATLAAVEASVFDQGPLAAYYLLALDQPG